MYLFWHMDLSKTEKMQEKSKKQKNKNTVTVVLCHWQETLDLSSNFSHLVLQVNANHTHTLQKVKRGDMVRNVKYGRNCDDIEEVVDGHGLDWRAKLVRLSFNIESITSIFQRIVTMRYNGPTERQGGNAGIERIPVMRWFRSKCCWTLEFQTPTIETNLYVKPPIYTGHQKKIIKFIHYPAPSRHLCKEKFYSNSKSKVV